jgi:hypothetical protein
LRTILIAAFVAGLGAIAAPPAQAQGEDATVLAAITNFMTGLRTRDTALIAAQIDSTTRFTLIRPGPNGSRLLVLRGADFLRAATRTDQPPLDEPIRNAKVSIDGDLASVWAEYQVRRDGAVTHCGYDAFHLARLGGKWKIINVSDSFKPTGCGPAW